LKLAVVCGSCPGSLPPGPRDPLNFTFLMNHGSHAFLFEYVYKEYFGSNKIYGLLRKKFK
jgi:hypothetical protein